MESDILKTHGLQSLPASTIQPMMMDTLTLNIGDIIPLATGNIVQQSMPAVHIEEVPVPSTVLQVHEKILESAAKNEDVTQALSTVWCEPCKGSMHQFVQDNVNIVQDLTSSTCFESVADVLKSSSNFGDFSRLSQEKPVMIDHVAT